MTEYKTIENEKNISEAEQEEIRRKIEEQDAFNSYRVDPNNVNYRM